MYCSCGLAVLNGSPDDYGYKRKSGNYMVPISRAKRH